MGWGNEPHEGYMARVLRDGRLVSQWSAETDALATGTARVCCTCGWQGGEAYPDTMEEEVDDRAHTLWRDTHMAPLIDPVPEHVLVLGIDPGGRRHYLAGKPVSAGTALEIRLAGDRWLRGRYEWSSFESDAPPRFYVRLGGRGEREGASYPVVDFALPPNAELRWPVQEKG